MSDITTNQERRERVAESSLIGGRIRKKTHRESRLSQSFRSATRPDFPTVWVHEESTLIETLEEEQWVREIPIVPTREKSPEESKAWRLTKKILAILAIAYFTAQSGDGQEVREAAKKLIVKNLRTFVSRNL